MLNFWNITGVPFLYCFQSLYVLRNQDAIDAAGYPVILSAVVFVMLTTGYFIFDTANGQKASCKIRIKRDTWPKLPWTLLEEPIAFIHTPVGDLLVGGWYAFARKMQYTGDILMALSWGLCCGFGSLLPYFYVCFFTCMILHRQTRDEIRCSKKYGKHWAEYTALVPNVFVPSAAFFKWIFLGYPHPYDVPGNPVAARVAADAAAAAARVALAGGATAGGSSAGSGGRGRASSYEIPVENDYEAEEEEEAPKAKAPRSRATTPKTKSRSTTPSKSKAASSGASEVSGKKSRSTTPSQARSTRKR